MDLNPEQFCQINFYHLKSNTKYVITDLNGSFHFVGTFEYCRKGSIDQAIFKNVICINPIERDCGYVSYSYNISRKYYTFITKKKDIQDAMEKRALKLILQNIIGDKNFEEP